MSEWEQLSNTLTIAWVAQALFITWNDNIPTTKDKKYYWKHIETNVIYALIYKNIQTA